MTQQSKASPVTVSDQQLMQDCITRYAWCLDRGDSRGVADCFTPDGMIVLTGGKRFTGAAELRSFAAEAGRSPGFRGRQHHVQPLFIETGDDGPVYISYYQVVRFESGKSPEIVSLGYYRDLFELAGGRWLLKRRNLHRWNSDLAPRAQVGPAYSFLLASNGEGLAPLLGPSLEDRLAINSLMNEYAASLDLGDLPRMSAAFEKDGVLISSSLGELVGLPGLRRFLARNTREPGFGGRQHRIFPLVLEPHDLGWRAYSYWKIENWKIGTPPNLMALGYYEDVFSKRSGTWKIASKAIRRWNSESAPMAEGWPEPI